MGAATFTADHVRAARSPRLDHVHIMGGCIGSSYCLGLCQAIPDRVTAAVLQNPIGLSEGAANPGTFVEMFDGWAEGLKKRRDDVHDDALTAFRNSMFGGEFVFSVDRDFLPRLLESRSSFSPATTSSIPKPPPGRSPTLAPTANLMLEWARPDHHDTTLAKVRTFLHAHTP